MENLDVNAAFWRKRKVLITGHTGFKGSWLSLWLQQLGARITGYSLPAPTNPSLFELAQVSDGMESVTADVRDLRRLSEVMAGTRPDVVIHMAAQSLVRDSYEHPVETYSSNVMGTVNVLEAVRQTGSVRAVIVVTSDKCYENREWLWGYRENEPMGGKDPYSSSKGCAELVTAAFRNSFFTAGRDGQSAIAVASARAGNVIGGGDWAKNRLVPDAMQAFLANRAAIIRNPRAIRPWQHVLEPLKGYLMLAQLLAERGSAFAEAWNFGPNDNDVQPVERVVSALASRWGSTAAWQPDGREHPPEAGVLKLDSSKARARLGWVPALDLATAVEWVVQWYRGYGNGDNVRRLTEDQIARYLALTV